MLDASCLTEWLGSLVFRSLSRVLLSSVAACVFKNKTDLAIAKSDCASRADAEASLVRWRLARPPPLQLVNSSDWGMDTWTYNALLSPGSQVFSLTHAYTHSNEISVPVDPLTLHRCCMLCVGVCVCVCVTTTWILMISNCLPLYCLLLLMAQAVCQLFCNIKNDSACGRG